MKVINSETGFLAYQKIFSSLFANQVALVAWQVQPETGHRDLCDVKITAFNLDTKLLHLEKTNKQNIGLNPSLSVYFYSDEAKIIFKTVLQEAREATFSVYLPNEVRLLDEDDVQDVRNRIGLSEEKWYVKRAGYGDNMLGDGYMRVKAWSERSSRDQEFLNQEFHPVNVDEEDKKYASQRESPRARPKADKRVKILVNNEEKVYKLFDLSQGGMGFLTPSFEDFETGLQIQIVGFDDFSLDDPLIGTIMSVRPIEGATVEFKVGVRFNEGQN